METTFTFNVESLGTFINIDTYEPAVPMITSRLRRVNNAIQSHMSGSEVAELANSLGLCIQVSQKSDEDYRHEITGVNIIENTALVYFLSNGKTDLRQIDKKDIAYLRSYIDSRFLTIYKDSWSRIDSHNEKCKTA